MLNYAATSSFNSQYNRFTAARLSPGYTLHPSFLSVSSSSSSSSPSSQYHQNYASHSVYKHTHFHISPKTKGLKVRCSQNEPLKVMISGAPASGKGTQCEMIVQKYGLVHISTGDLLRSEVAAGSDIGNQAKEYMNTGRLVPDEVVIAMVIGRLSQEDAKEKGWLLDGFPRSFAQAQSLEKMKIKPDVFIALDVPDEILIDRCVGRRLDPETGKIYHIKNFPPETDEVKSRLVTRPDDTEEKVKSRLQIYKQNVGAILSTYSDVLKKIDGNHSKDVVFGEINSLLLQVQKEKVTRKSGNIRKLDSQFQKSPATKENWRGIPTNLNNIPHSREIREYFYDDVLQATQRAINDGKTRVKVEINIPELNPEQDVYRIGTLMELVRVLALSFADDGKRVKVIDEKTGSIRWVPTKMNIDNHVIVPKLDPNIPFPDKFVDDYLSNLSRSTIETSKPLWELHLLDIKTTEDQGTGVFRVHHSLGDGLSLMTLFLACTRQSSDVDALPTLPVSKDSGYIKFTSFWSVLEVFWNSIVALMMFVFTVLFLKDTETPLKGTIGVENRPRRFVRKSINLADIKAVKNAMNVTLNDVVLGVTQAALSCYLNRRYSEIGDVEKTDHLDKNNFIPKNIRLRATFFFNLRATTRIDTLVETMKTGTVGRWGNKIGYVLLPFAIGLKSNPLDYVKEAKAVIDRKKASLEPLYTYFIVYLVLKLFGIKAVGKLNHKVFFNTTLWFTNVPGPQQQVTFSGHDVTYIAPSCYGQPNALMIHILSYMDKLTFVISADEETMPDPHRLCDDIEESLRLIKNAALETETAKNK